MDKKRRFKFKLASHLGMTVSELENRMSQKEFIEWQEYLALEPTTSDRNEFMIAQLTSALIRVNGGKATAHDLMISLSKEDKQAIKIHEANSKIDDFFKERD